MRPLILGLALFLVLACGGSPINQESFARIETGMSREDVVGILGEPTGGGSFDVGVASGSSLVWEDEHGAISIQFFNDKVKAKQFTTKN